MSTNFLPPGTYELRSTYATFEPSSLTVNSDGTESAATATIDNDAPATFEVDATSTSDQATSYAMPWSQLAPPLSYDEFEYEYLINGFCFGPGDTVDITISGANAVAPSTVTADAQGAIAVSARLTATSTRQSVTAQATDTSSGRTLTGVFPVPATTLPSGAGLSPSDIYAYQQLYSPDMTYRFRLFGCTVELEHFLQIDGQFHDVTVWWAGTGSYLGSCRLRLSTTGDLALTYAATGKLVWHTGSEGTGSQNRLVTQNDGNVVLYTSANHPVWSSKAGLIRGPHGYITRVSIGDSRSGSTVHIAARVRQFNINGTLLAGEDRLAHLERWNGTAWKVLQSKHTDTAGRVSFGFQQHYNHSYRVYVAATSSLASASSPYVFI